MALSRFGDIGSRAASYNIVEMLKRMVPLMPLERFGQSEVVPLNMTQTVKWRRFEPLPVTTVPLTEGVTPAGHTPTVTDVTANLVQYGGFIRHSDVILDVATDPILANYRDLLAQQCAETLETVRYQSLLAGSNVFYANGTARSAVNTVVSATLLRKVARMLVRNNAREFTSVVASSPNYASQAVEAAYIVPCHPDLEYDIRQLPGFIHKKNYGPGVTALPGELGSWERFRFIESTLFAPFYGAGGTKGSMIGAGTAADVYPMIVLAMDAWATVVLRGSYSGSDRSADGTSVVSPVDLIVKNPGSGGAEDPMNQRGSVSWKTMFTAQILQDAWMCRVEVAATEL